VATHRDEVRANRQALFRKAREVGIDVDAERRRVGANQRTLAFEAGKLLNDGAPRTTSEQLRIDNPPAGMFDGANTTFVLSAPALGANITVIWGDMTTPQTVVLAKVASNPPPINSFFFDINFPTSIIVGNAPKPGDALVAVYRVKG
jgi:hypothetical protein